jgi:hypothetical protein
MGFLFLLFGLMGNHTRNIKKNKTSKAESFMCVCVCSFGVCCGSRAVALLLPPPAAGRKRRKKKKTQKFNEPLPTHTIEEEEYPCCVEKVQIYR